MIDPSLEDVAFQQQFEQARLATVRANLTEPRAIAAHLHSEL